MFQLTEARMRKPSMRLASATFLAIVMACAEGTAPGRFRPENIERGDDGSMQATINDATLYLWSVVSTHREDGLLVI